MKKVLNSLVVFAAFVFCFTASVSCNKMEIKGGNVDLFFNIQTVGYYYNASCQGYDILFLEEPNVNIDAIEEFPEKYFGVDLHESFLGTHDLTEDLDDDDWSFFIFLPYSIYGNEDFESGSITLDVDREAGKVTFKIDGILKETGQRLRVNYTGPAQKIAHYPFD